MTTQYTYIMIKGDCIVISYEGDICAMALSEGIKRGTVELLILTLLQDQDMYGYQLSQEFTRRSNGLYTLQESTMYPTLYRLVDKGILSDRQEKVGKRKMRVYYHLEEPGREYLKRLRKEYCSICRGVLSILDITDMKTLEEEGYGQ